MFDVCIIGAGGIIGCSIAREFAMRGLTVAALEKHDSPCQEISGLNSRVIHSGFHETPGTLKSSLAREGSALIIRYARERGIKLLNTGMLIAVPHGGIQSGLWKEAASVWSLWKRGHKQNVPLEFVFTPRGVRQIAPIYARGGIFIPSVCVVDIEALARSLAADASEAGATFSYSSEVMEISADGPNYVVRTAKDETRSRVLINSAGLNAPAISRMAGGPDYDIELLRGDYYELIGGVEKWNIRTLIYPATPPGSLSKGIHFGPRTDGRLYIGPSASRTMERAPKQVFLEAAQRFIREISETDLQWAYAGIRPKNKTPDGKPDFIIRIERKTPLLLNLIGIDSPGLSASMAIARHVAELVNPVVSRRRHDLVV